MKQDDIIACRSLAEEFVSINGGGTIGRKLGDGGSAVVFRWENPGAVRALKVYDPKFFASDAAEAERHRLNLQRRLIKQQCASMVDTLAVDEDLDTCFVTMELCAGDELKKVVGRVPDEAVAPLIRQLVDAVCFLEKFGLVHRDIKPENILVSQDFTKLCLLDLGVVREISDDEDRIDGTDHGVKRLFIATAQYSSPEYLFRLEPPSPSLWKALTIYQVGGVLHDLICKKVLFNSAVAADNKYALAMAVMREPPDFIGASANLSSWTALAARCLTKDGGLRLQLVDWTDFSEQADSVRDKLKRALTACAANANRAALNDMQARNLGIARVNQLKEIADELSAQLIGELSPQLRVSNLGGDENRFSLFLKIADVDLGVKLAVECSWNSGVQQNIATVRLAAKTALEQSVTEFSGERHAIGEIDVEGEGRAVLLETLMDAVRQVLVKHTELTEVGSITDGADLVVLSWPSVS